MQFQEYLNELNEAARHRPRIGLIIALAQVWYLLCSLGCGNGKLISSSFEVHLTDIECFESN